MNLLCTSGRARSRALLVAAAALAVPLALVASSPAKAAILALGLDTVFTGSAPDGAAPWITATFDDSFGDANTVRLTLSAGNLSGKENVKDWAFNFDPLLDAAFLTFTAIDIADSIPVSVTSGNNFWQADGDGRFDIRFRLPPPKGQMNLRLTGGESIVYDITYTSAIDVNSFNYSSVMGGGNGSFLSAAHIQNTGPQNKQSGRIGAVPEPSTFLLLGVGLAGFASIRPKFAR